MLKVFFTMQFISVTIRYDVAMANLQTGCCIVGGGPAGVMLGWLLARAGVRVTVLEKHKDFFRDFRGDTVHPSTLELLYELGVLEDFLEVPHQKMTTAGASFGGFDFTAADFRTVSTHCKFVVLMPQWDFLDFVTRQARRLDDFELRMEHEVTGLLRDGQRVVGVQVQTPEGVREIRADLVVGCDGRHATTREAAGFEVIEAGVPIDVLWFRVGRTGDEPERLLGTVNYGKALILINRGDHYQAGLIIRKGSFDEVRRAGLDAFRASLVQIAPYLDGRVQEVQCWDQVKLLSIQINRLRRWHTDGLLCIGDAAHAMSPAGGVGINLAIQDAVAAANLLSGALRHGPVEQEALRRVQCRREFPVRATQALQRRAHHLLASGVFTKTGPMQAPWQLKVAVKLPGLQRILARVVGVGVRPEHVGKSRRSASPVLQRLAIFAGVALGAAVLLIRKGQ
jgi:2-polyprenyl-6-methoxyphenol hydroxylase-like FAD-dependent oxidoreductase